MDMHEVRRKGLGVCGRGVESVTRLMAVLQG